jgi:gamma-glutamylcyclotransferase (GGCT)/AIG2-like uncharacterized protein YtfP
VTADDAASRHARGSGADSALHRLATYGTLAPGRLNAHQLDGLDGRWLTGHIHGTLVDAGWGAHLGYPALVLDPGGPAVDVDVFESADLPDRWARLDAFEGSGYRRVVTSVHTSTGDLDASIYVVAQDQTDDERNLSQ